MNNPKKEKRKNSKEFNKKFKNRFFDRKVCLIIAFTAICLVGIVFGCLDLEKKINAYEKEIKEITQEVSELEKTNKDLQKQMDEMNTDEYIERIARERLGMVRKGEYVLKQSQDRIQDDSDDSNNKKKNK